MTTLQTFETIPSIQPLPNSKGCLIIPVDDTTSKILIHSNKYGDFETLIDREDEEKVRSFSWYIQWSYNTFYIVAAGLKNGKRTAIPLQKFIMNTPEGYHTDHIGGSSTTLDNRKQNLRVVSCRGNHSNRQDQSSFGVGVRSANDKFLTQLKLNGKRYYLPNVSHSEMAAWMYDVICFGLDEISPNGMFLKSELKNKLLQELLNALCSQKRNKIATLLILGVIKVLQHKNITSITPYTQEAMKLSKKN